MKVLTLNFVTCAVKSCKSSSSSFPLHVHDAELEESDVPYNAVFLHNIMPRVDWEALRTTAAELGFNNLPEAKPESAPGGQAQVQDEQVWKDLHRLLMCVAIKEGKLLCASCGHTYRVREGIANFLLPNILV